MTKDWQRQLADELGSAGASTTEIQQLLPIAAGLRQLKNSTSQITVEPAKSKRFFSLRAIVPIAATGLISILLLIMLSQSAMPTDKLYQLQKLSDSIRATAQHGYRANVMMKRAEQVNKLASSHANAKAVLTALNDYNDVAKSYKDLEHTNFAAYKYCETNLRAAAKHASPDVKREISKSLQSLDAS